MNARLHTPTAAPQPVESPALDRADLVRLEQTLFREWLEADGRGGYAGSSVHLCPTSRYHGLLVAPPPGGGERHVFLSRLEEEVVGHNRTFPLSTCRYGGIYSPEGYQSIESFAVDPFPTWTYRIGEVELVREVLALRGRHAVLVRWSRRGGPPGLALRLRPMLAFRRTHDLHHENFDLDARALRIPEGGIACQLYGSLPRLSLTLGGAGHEYHADPLWYRGVELVMDLRRGFPGVEDHFSPGQLEVALEDGGEVVLAATIEDAVQDPCAAWAAESARRRAAVEEAGESFLGRLSLAAEHFLYRDESGRPGVVAGYPWFGEWGRDTFLALPGLTLARGRIPESLEVLEGALPFLKDGLLPNVFGPTPERSSYRSADAALWFARAVLLHERASGDAIGVRQRFHEALASVAEAYLAGTDLGLRVQDGLLHAGGPDLNATWMDAMVDGEPVTPRAGCPVELQALWYQLLAHLQEMAEAAGDRGAAARWRREAERAGEALVGRYWLPGQSTLADLVREDGSVDASERPNAVIAAALELSPLSSAQRADVVQVALGELLTPRGLRTLSPHDPRYRGRYEGGPAERDGAYHQGTVWPWLLGFLVEAALRAFPARGARVRRVRQTVLQLAQTLGEHGLGQVSEVFDGDPPHRPGGATAQAWSVAEILRALVLLRER